MPLGFKLESSSSSLYMRVRLAWCPPAERASLACTKCVWKNINRYKSSSSSWLALLLVVIIAVVPHSVLLDFVKGASVHASEKLCL